MFRSNVAVVILIVVCNNYLPFYINIIIIYGLLSLLFPSKVPSKSCYSINRKTNNVECIIDNRKIILHKTEISGLYDIDVFFDNKFIDTIVIKDVLFNKTIILGLPKCPSDFGFKRCDIYMRKSSSSTFVDETRHKFMNDENINLLPNDTININDKPLLETYSDDED